MSQIYRIVWNYKAFDFLFDIKPSLISYIYTSFSVLFF